MSAAPASASEAVLVAVQQAAPGLVRAFDAEHSTRFEAALEALAPNTRRAYGGALAAWGRWAAGVSSLKLAATARSGCSSASVLQRGFRLHDGLSDWSETVFHVCIMR